MKLKNLLFATMFACAFASCSSDDDPIDNGGGNNGDVDATFSLKFETPVITKSGDTDGKDNAISTLNVYVFNGTGDDAVLEKIGKSTSSNEARDIPVSSGDKSVVVVANHEPKMTEKSSTLSDLYQATKEFGDTEKNGTISMNSRTYVVSISAGRKNYLGYKDTEAAGGKYLVPTEATGGDLQNKPVKLYRNVAKINLEKVSVDTEGSKNEYSNAKFILKDVFVLHAPKTSYVVGGALPWNPTYYAANSAWLGGPVAGDVNTEGTYKYWAKIIQDWKKANEGGKEKKPFLANGQGYEGGLAPFQYNETINETIMEGESYPKGVVENPSIDYFYSYENLSDTHTLLVVKGKFLFGENPKEEDFDDRYYSVSVGHDNTSGSISITPPDGAAARKDNAGVLRNMQYNIALTVKGPGWETPFGPDGTQNTFMDVKVEVVSFRLVSQVVEIE